MGRWSYRELPSGLYDIITVEGQVITTVKNQPTAFFIVAEANRKMPTLH